MSERKEAKIFIKEEVIGLTNDWDDFSLDELAKKYGVSKARIKAIGEALNKKFTKDDGTPVCPPKPSRGVAKLFEQVGRELNFKTKQMDKGIQD